MSSVLDRMVPTDGRWLRSVRTRAAIIDAWVELVDEGDLAPTAKGVADRAGIGLRTVFQHFSDMHSLHFYAGEHLTNLVRQRLAPVPADLPLDERIDRLTASRAEAWEAITLFRRACERQEWLSQEIHDLIDCWERTDAACTLRVFAPEFEAMCATDDPTLKHAVDAVLSWSTWNQLRQRRQLDGDDAQAAIRFALHSLLGINEPRW